MDQETYPYQVSIWLFGNGNKNSFFERGRWLEQARCDTPDSANEVAECLSMRWKNGVQIAELVNGKFVGYKFIPTSASELK